MLAPASDGRGYIAARWTHGSHGGRVTALLTPGDVVEFAADYSEPRRFRSDRQVPVRWFGVVLVTHPERVVVLGPYGGPDAAWDVANLALSAWRESHHVTVAELTGDSKVRQPEAVIDPSRELPTPGGDGAPDAGRREYAGEASRAGAEADTRPERIRVDDEAHGTLVVDAERFGAAMALGPERCAELVALTAPDVALTGREPVATLAALVACHAPMHLDGPSPTATDPGDCYFGRPDGAVTRGRQPVGGRHLSPPRRWSPDGFGWGHDGDGARELGFALVADATGSPDAARRLGERCTAEMVARLPAGRPWALPVDQVRTWVATVDAGLASGVAAAAPVSNPEPGL